MLLEYFKQYIKITRGVTDKSVGHYITGLNTINSLLAKYDYPIKNVFEVKSVEDLDGILLFLTNNEEFKKKDSVGHNMYSVAFKHFYRFASEDKEFFSNNIANMDILVAKPQKITTTSTAWKRNQILIAQAIDGAHHLCEHNREHLTFTAKSTGKTYMEGHHLIPLKYQSEFTCGIDVYLFTHGIAPSVISQTRKYFQGGKSIPLPLKIVRHYGNCDISLLATEILGLSKMNWNSFNLYSKLPCTIESSNEIARIGWLLSQFEGTLYDYRFFM